jgi:N-acetylmuramic acid 6-phosphate etherase
MADQSKWQRLPTEAINTATRDIDMLPMPEVVALMIADTRVVLEAVEREKDQIAAVAEILAGAVRRGGRLIFVGAGTSGRLGVLEAAEMPPTFGISNRVVHAIMAGGMDAVSRAREGVEDDEKEGGQALGRLKPAKNDVVIGVSASGVTPFVRGALLRAKRAGARRIGITCDPKSEMRTMADPVIALATGPEVIAGSTRLKAGTATKIVLNMLTTSAMIRIGKTYGNLMVDVQSNSDKLRDRGRRIISIATGLGYDDADALLRRAKWNVKAAIVMQKTGLTHAKALQRLRAARDSVRAAIGEAAPPLPYRQ